MDKFQELMDKYYSVFEEHFPTMDFQTATDEELMQKMEQCLKENKPAEVVFNLDYDNAVY